MKRTFVTGIAGEAQVNNDGITRQSIIRNLHDGDPVTLIREPSNRFDPSAIKLMSRYGQIGYIARRVASDLAIDMDRGGTVSATIKDIRGDYPDPMGVWIEVTLIK